MIRSVFAKARGIILSGLIIAGSASSVHAVPITWDNGAGGSDLNWSTNANWNPDNAPGGNDLTFNNTGTSGVSGTTTNTVSASVAVNSLSYASTSNFHTTQINNLVTLTVNGGHFYVGPGGSGNSTTNVVMKGSSTGVGTFTYNAPSFDFVVGRPMTAFSGTQDSTLDASALGTMNITANQLFVGEINPNGTGIFNMAASNNVTVDQIRVGGWNNGGTIRLGTTNVINADSIELGWAIENQGGAQSRLQFNTGLTSPTVTIRNKAGSGRANLSMGWGSNGAGTGILDLTGGTADVMLGTVIAGRPRTVCCNADGAGTITFNAGTIDATTVTLGQSSAGAQTSGSATGTVNINGTGIFIADMINLAQQNSNFSSATGVVNLNGGTLLATAIQAGPVTGTGAVTRQLNLTTGTLTHKTGTDLTVSSAISVRLIGNATKTVFADTGRIVTINGIVQNSGGGPFAGLTKTGDGRLNLNGVNTYTGDTSVNGGTLGGTGTIGGNLLVSTGATVAPGNSAGVLSVLGSVTFASGSTLSMEVTGPNAVPGVDYDRLAVAGAVNNLSNADLVVNFSGVTFADLNGDVLTLVTTVSNLSGTSFNSVTYNNAPFFWATVTYGAGFVSLSNFSAIPEPSTAMLVGLGLVGFAVRRRRRHAAA